MRGSTVVTFREIRHMVQNIEPEKMVNIITGEIFVVGDIFTNTIFLILYIVRVQGYTHHFIIYICIVVNIKRSVFLCFTCKTSNSYDIYIYIVYFLYYMYIE